MNRFNGKKKVLFFLYFLFSMGQLFGQSFDLGPKIRGVWDEIVSYWPVAMTIVFVASAIFFSEDFVGENRDIKRGFKKIAAVLAFVVVVGLGAKFILSIRLGA